MKAIETAKENQFYPTPKEFLEQICKDIQWDQVHTILEPSAGKGNIVDFLKEVEEKGVRKSLRLSDGMRSFKQDLDFDIDVIEIEEDLQNILKGKKYRLVHDDFLTFDTYKHYDLILMNPPFCNAERHLIKAIQMQKKYGGNIICILNAETIRNPYSLERKQLAQMLEEYGADFAYYEGAFSHSEHPTDVSIAVVKMCIPERKTDNSFIEELRKKDFHDNISSKDELAHADYIEAIIQQYNLELAGCLHMLEEYRAFKPYILDLVKNKYAEPVIELKINGEPEDKGSMNQIVKLIRKKYWEALFKNPKFTKGMTSAQIEGNMALVAELEDYDFSFYNIKKFQIEMVKKRAKGIEECIMSLFDELSHEYSWLPETGRNIHYYNGWSSNKAYMVNKKVVIPFYDLWSQIWKRYEYGYKIVSKLSDIEKVFDYLNGTPGRESRLAEILKQAETDQKTKKIETRYFVLDFYKKGTCHITFTDEDLLKRFNIAGGRGKAWLPPCYGKKSYKNMTAEEKNVINEFEGKKSYETVCNDPGHFLFQPDLPILIA